MYITKAQSRLLAIGVVLVFFVVAFAMMRSPSLPTVAVTPRPTLDPQPTVIAAPVAAPSQEANVDPLATPVDNSQITLNTFHRSEIKNGVKIWEVDAARGEYLADQSAVRVHQATIFLYRGDKGPLQLDCDEATMKLENGELRNAELKGNIVVHYAKAVVRTDHAFYNPVTSKIFAPGTTTVESEMFDVIGDALSVDVTTHDVVFTKNVRSKIKPRERKHG